MSTVHNRILILNGPNLNLLGKREPHIYGKATYLDLEAVCHTAAGALGYQVGIKQTNHEGILLEAIQQAENKVAGLIINAAGYSHTSVALHDALRTFSGIKVEVHLSNIHAREAFRHHSLLSAVVNGCICGFGIDSYRLAIYAIDDILKRQHR